MLAAITVAAFVLPYAFAQQANYDGILYASSFDTWSVPPGNNGPYAWSNPSACTVTSGGLTFPAFTVGTPILISDANPAHSEVVTPTKVTITGSGCSITINPVYSHTSFVLESATGGLQEAVDYSIRQNVPAVVAVTPQFDGTTSTITSATGNTNVSILDARDANMCAYDWNGSAYAKSGCFGAASSGVTSLNSLTGALNIAAGTGLSVGASGSTITLANTATATCTTDQLVYYATTGATPSCLTLGANLSIGTGGVLNATGGTPAGSTYATQYNNAGSFGGTGPGTSGYVLTSNGTSGPPTFQAVASGGSYPPNPAGTIDVYIGDSAFNDDIDVLSQDTQTVTNWTCAGSGSCSIGVASTTGYAVGDYVVFAVSQANPTTTSITPVNNDCTAAYAVDLGVGYGPSNTCGWYKILPAGFTSTSFEIAYTGAATSCSSSCGTATVSQAQAFPGPLMQNSSGISGHGTVYWMPDLNGYSIAAADTDFATLFASLPNGSPAAPVRMFIGALSNDIADGESAATIEGHIASILTKCHARAWECFAVTVPSLKGALVASQVDQWIRQQNLTPATLATGAYVDWQIDIGPKWSPLATFWNGNGSMEPQGAQQYAQFMNQALGYNIPIQTANAQQELDCGTAALSNLTIGCFFQELQINNSDTSTTTTIGGDPYLGAPVYTANNNNQDTGNYVGFEYRNGTSAGSSGTATFDYENYLGWSGGSVDGRWRVQENPFAATGIGINGDPFWWIQTTGQAQDSYYANTGCLSGDSGGNIVSGCTGLNTGETATSSATPTFSSTTAVSRLVLTANVTSFTLANGTDGQIKTLCFEQGSGPYTVTAPSNVGGFFTVGTTSGDWNCQSFTYDGYDGMWLATTPGVTNETAQGIYPSLLTSVALTSSTSIASVTSPSVTVPAGGVWVVCGDGADNGVGSIPVSDSGSHTWTETGFGYNWGATSVYFSNFATSSTVSFTCTPSVAGGYQSMLVLSEAGATLTQDVSGNAGGGGTGTTSITTPAFTTTSANEIVMLCAAASTNGAATTFTTGTIGTGSARIYTVSGTSTGCAVSVVNSIQSGVTATINWTTGATYPYGVYGSFTY